jgi:hypothetical protein
MCGGADESEVRRVENGKELFFGHISIFLIFLFLPKRAVPSG